MKIIVTFIGFSPVDLTEPQCKSALFHTIYDLTERVGSLGEFEITLGGVRCLGAYEVIEPGLLVHVELAFIAAGAGPHGHLTISEDGRPEILIEIEDEDIITVELDDGAIAGTA